MQEKRERKLEVTFTAVFSKAITTVDGGWRVSFDVGEHESESIADLARLRDESLQVACIVITQNTKSRFLK